MLANDPPKESPDRNALAIDRDARHRGGPDAYRAMLRSRGAILAALALSGLLGCGAPERSDDGGDSATYAEGELADAPSIVLISIDTLRADHLGSYGYSRDTSPRLDRFAERAIRFTKAYAPAPWTLPSHVAMLSGRHPSLAGVRGVDANIEASVPMLAEVLRGAGYRTAAFVDSKPGSFVGAKRGFARGFEIYEHQPHGDASWRVQDAANTVRVAREWLDRTDRARPFFLFLHTKTVHSLRNDESERIPAASPYDAPEPFRWRYLPDGERDVSRQHVWRDESGAGPLYLRARNEDIAAGEDAGPAGSEAALRELVARYDAGIRYTDHHVGSFLDHLDRSGWGSRTIVIVTSDHGEAFLEHRFFLHQELHSDLLRVPLLVRAPGEEPRTEDTPVSLEDLAPTLLRRAGLSVPEGTTGVPLPLGGSSARTQPRRFFAANLRDLYQGTSLREGKWLLIRDRVGDDAFASRLYDTESDPGEQRPVVDQEARHARMERALVEWNERSTAVHENAGALDEQTLEELRALGYID